MGVSLSKSGQFGPQEPRNPYEAHPPVSTDAVTDPTGPDATPLPATPIPAAAVSGYINDADLLRLAAGQEVSDELMERVLHLFDTFDVRRPTLDPALDFEQIMRELLAAFNGCEENVQSFMRCVLVLFAPLPVLPPLANWYPYKRRGRYDLTPPMGPVFAPGSPLADAADNSDAMSVLRSKPAAVDAMRPYLHPSLSAVVALYSAVPLIHDLSRGEQLSSDAGTRLVERITSQQTPPNLAAFNDSDIPPAI